MKVIACITERGVVPGDLRSMGLPEEAPEPVPARAPPGALEADQF